MNGQHLSYDDCLKVRKEKSKLFYAVLCTTVVHSDSYATHMWTVLKCALGLGLYLVLCVLV